MQRRVFGNLKKQKTMKPITIYISGKISGLADLNKPKFAAAAVLIKDLYRGHHNTIINPHDLDHSKNEKKEWELYIRICLIALMKADEVVVLDDWKQSRGAIIEVLLADLLGMDIYPIETPTRRIVLSKKTKLKLVIKVLLNII